MELLVVITIITVLLALLAPALDKAIYQAELAQCAAKHRAVAAGVTSYAMEHTRRYPHRPYVTQNDLDSNPATGSSNSAHQAWPMNVSQGNVSPDWDDRPRLAPYFPLNATLNCPLIAPIDIEGSKNDTMVFGTFNLWYGWQYRIQTGGLNIVMKGMFKMGDRWNWTWIASPFGGPVDLQTDMLTSTRYFANRGFLYSGTHPGKDSTSYYLSRKQDQPEGNSNMTYVRWDTTVASPPPLDINTSYADLSVRRLNDGRWNNDPRTVPVPSYANGADSNYNNIYEVLPKN